MRLKYFCLYIAFLVSGSLALQAQSVSFTRTEITCHGANDATMKMTRTGGASTYWYVYLNLTNPAQSDSVGPTNSTEYTFIGLPSDDLLVFYVRDNATGMYIGSLLTSFTDKVALSATVNKTNVTCFGASTGTITISSPAGGSGVFDYSINGGGSWQTTGNYTGLAAGNYNVQIRDRNNPGCIKVLNAALQITQNAQMNATLTSANPTCWHSNNGTITITNPTGGSGSGYQYTITGTTPWASSGSYTALAPGTYNVVMRDQSFTTCTRTLNGALVLTEPTQLTVSDIVINKGLTCNEGSDGVLQAVVSGGTPPYTYTWNIRSGSSWVPIGQTGQTATNLAQGRYQVIVNDSKGCGPANAVEYFFEGFTDSIPPVFNFDNAVATTTCSGQTNGSIQISASGGVNPYKYSITTGGASGYQPGSLFSNLAAGTYQPWVMDKKGCKKNGANVIVGTTASVPVSVSIAANPSGSICPGTSVQFTATPVNGGTAPAYQWTLNGANVGANQATYTNAALASGDQVKVILTSDIRCTTGNPATSNTLTTALKTVTAISGQPASATQCAGTNVTFTVTANGTNLTYQWRKNGTNIPGANSPSYTINNIAAGDAAAYSVVVTGDCGTATSNNATLVVNANTAISTQPQAQTKCAGTSVTFSVTATGTNLTYQWRKNGTAIGGANSSSYTIASVAAGDAGNYSVIVSGDCGGSVTSSNALLTVNPVTSISAQPAPVTVCAGAGATFTVTATGSNLTYQWRKNGTNITGANSNSYTIAATVAGDAGNYSVVVTGDCGTVTSNNAALVVNAATVIAAQPQSLTRCAGTSATFSVTATGSNLAYQWRKNGTAIGGANSSSYTIASVAAGDAGNYSVIVSGDCGNVTSTNASLTVNPVTAITVQPSPVTVCAGTGATFTITATGSNLTYQWRKNGSNISGANSNSYTIAATVAGDAGNYSVVVTGDCGTLTSNNAALTVNAATAISVQPSPVTQCAGTSATFTVTATGTNLTYQWRKNGTAIGGANSSSYTIASIAAGDAGNYSVVVSGDCGANVTSGNAALTVNPLTAITGQPNPVTQCAGTSATFAVTAVGTNLTYQWKKNGANITGATSASYTIASIAAGDAGNYTVTVTGTCGGSVTSNSVALTVNPATAISVQPQPVTQCVGTNATFTVTATGTNLVYQWRKNGTAIPGANTSSYTITGIAAGDAGNYSVVVSGDCGANVTSGNAALTVNPATAISVQPLSLTQCAGTSASFSVTATGVNLTYQWRKNGTNITGATSATYTIASIAAGDAANYSVVVTGGCGAAVTSVSATLTVNPLTAITVQPQPLTQCEGTNATFTVTAAGTGLGYQWRKNGTAIPGATASSYTINGIVAGDAGNYSVVVSGGCGANVTSNAVALTVNPATSITQQPTSVLQCAGTSATFTVTAAGVNLKYQWRKNGSNITGATNRTYTIASIAAGDVGNFDVVVTGDCGAAVTSNTVTLALNPATAITSQPTSVTECAGNSVTFSVTADGLNLTYQWKKNGTNITGANGSTYTIASIAAGDAANYSVTVTGTCGSVTSNNAALTVNNAPVITLQPVAATQCAGTNVTFRVTASGANLTYLWRKNGNPIFPAETNSTLVITAIDAADGGNYDVVVSNSCGDATSNAVALTVAQNPVITGHPVDQDLCEGSDVTFAVTATGTNLIYQWRKDGVNIPGQTTSTLDLTSISLADAATYDVRVYGMCDTITSNPAVLLVYQGTVADIINSDTIVCKDASVQFTVAAIGAGSISYQWQHLYYGSWIDVANDSRISGSTTTTLSIDPVDYADTGYYRVLVTADCGSSYSDLVRLDVNSLVATIGTPAPFLINTATTSIEVGVKITNHFLKHDLGFALVAPDGTEVLLKGPGDFCVPNHPISVNVHFTTKADPADTINYCVASNNITGNFAATGDWSVLNGMDPSNGAWQVRIYDAENANGDPADGLLTSATLTFTDLDTQGDTAVVSYNSGNIATGIQNPINTELRPTSYVVPIRLMTTCFNSNDAHAIVTVSGGVAPFTYVWTGPVSLPDENDVMLGPGTYSVLVTDALGCTSVATVEVSAPPAITFDDVQHTDTLLCHGSSDGFIRTKASGGNEGIVYTLIPGDIASSVADSGVFLNLAAGTYTIRATDLNGCSLDSTITIYEHDLLVVNVEIVPVIGTDPGSITLTASGGLPPYEYSIDNGTTVQDSGEFTNLAAGIYHVLVTDSLGCTFAQDVNLNVEMLNVDVTKHDVSCYGLADGSFFLALIDGTGPYTLTGSFTDTLVINSGAFSFTGQTAGSYDVKIEDSEGRLFMSTIVISEPSEIVATASITDATCSAVTTDGAIDVTVTGGSGEYTYEWSNGGTTQDLAGIEAGNYKLVVSDTNGCNSGEFDFTVIGLNQANAYAGEDDTICPGTEYQLFGSPIADSVKWEPANLLDDNTLISPIATVQTRTPFIYTVYDNGCYDKDTVVIDVHERIGMDIYDPSGEQVSVGDSLYLLEGETATLAATPGFVSYHWDPATGLSDPDAQAVVLTPGSTIFYTVFGTTDKGCVETDMVKVVIARKIKIYTGFSPNGDAYNQTWRIENAWQYGERIRVRVFNRWGELVFDSKGYSVEWDGTRNGKLLPIGAYYYIIDVKDGKSEPYTGTVTILR
jgi:gliding motility-associated-like protein